MPPGGVRVIGTSAALAAALRASCVATQVSITDTTLVLPAELADAVDAAARAPDVVAIGLAVHDAGEHGRFQAVLRAVSLHVPVVAYVAAPPADVWLGPWLGRHGAVVRSAAHAAASALAVLSAAVPAGGSLGRIHARDGHARTFAARAALAAGFVLTRDGEDESADLELAHVGDLEDAAWIASRAASATAIGVVDGTSAGGAALRAELVHHGVCCVDLSVDLTEGLRGLREWSEFVRTGASTPALSVDVPRVRRAAAQKTPTAPEVQRAYAAAVGLPFAQSRRAGYLDDIPLAAAGLGYPVVVGFWHAAAPSRRVGRWVKVSNAETLLKASEATLAAFAAEFGRGTDTLVASALPSSTLLQVEIERAGGYGAVGRVLGGDSEVAAFLAPAAMRDIDPRCEWLGEGVPAAVAQVVNAGAALLQSDSAVRSVSACVEAAPAGFVCRSFLVEVA